jgi:hypothetical protein
MLGSPAPEGDRAAPLALEEGDEGDDSGMLGSPGSVGSRDDFVSRAAFDESRAAINERFNEMMTAMSGIQASVQSLASPPPPRSSSPGWHEQKSGPAFPDFAPVHERGQRDRRATMLVRALAGEKFSSPGGASPLVQPQGFSGSRDLPGPSLDEGDVGVRETFHGGRLLDPLSRLPSRFERSGVKERFSADQGSHGVTADGFIGEALYSNILREASSVTAYVDRISRDVHSARP